jgi:hypothetical protein
MQGNGAGGDDHAELRLRAGTDSRSRCICSGITQITSFSSFYHGSLPKSGHFTLYPLTIVLIPYTFYTVWFI